jgi:hypothetical protein
MNNLVASKNEVSQMNERTVSTIKNIKDLQDLEKSLYSQLENTASSPSPPSLQEQEKAIQRINELSNMRATLFGNLQDTYSMNQYQVAQTRNDLVDELTSVKVIEGELNNSKKQMNALKQEKINKLRMVEINTYYGKRYESHANIMKIIILACIPIIILSVLTKKNIISNNISNVLMAIVVVIFILVMWYRIGDILFRDNMDYDQYKFPFDPQNVDLDNSGTDNVVYLPDALDLGIECVGDSCCKGDNMVYDNASNICVVQKTNGDSSDGDNNDDVATMTKEAFSSHLDDKIELQPNKNVLPYSEGESNFVKF